VWLRSRVSERGWGWSLASLWERCPLISQISWLL